jgi:membrane protease YdiL (CAAX protease family)
MIALTGLALAVLTLALRGVGTWSFVVPVAGGVTAMAAVRGAVARRIGIDWFAVTGLGCLGFAAVRFFAPVHAQHVGTAALLASVVAAVGEELVFRHGVYGILERFGPVAAVIGAAAMFGVVHAPMYGWTIVPLDVAAGLVFGWQRWATGSWTSPAAAHAVANVLAAI